METLGALLEANGFEIILAKNGAECLCILEKDLPDLVILDIMMPGFLGSEICDMLKGREARYKDLPIIILSAKARGSDSQIGEIEHADSYFMKPYDSDELLKKINELLKASNC